MRNIWLRCVCSGAIIIGSALVGHSDTRFSGRLAYVRDGNLWVQIFPDGAARQISHGAPSEHPRWSFSGRWVSFEQSNRVTLVSVEPGLQEEVTLDTRHALWSPRRDEVAFVDDGSLVVLSSESVPWRKRVIVRPSAGQTIVDFRWSLDGATSAVATSDSSHRLMNLWSVDADAGRSRQVPLSRSLADHFKLADWPSDGSRILMWVGADSESIAADGLPLVSVDASTGETRVVTESALQYPEYVSVAPSGDHSLVITGGDRRSWTNKRLVAFTAASSDIMPLTGSDVAVAASAWSPDGYSVAFAAGPDNKEAAGGDRAKQALAERRIWTIGFDGRQKRQLTADPRYRDEYPLWSRDGQHIVFMRMDRQNAVSVWSVGVNDGTVVKLVDRIMGPSVQESWFGYYGRIGWPAFVALSQ
jgi:Tol biopolymer transport system component